MNYVKENKFYEETKEISNEMVSFVEHNKNQIQRKHLSC